MNWLHIGNKWSLSDDHWMLGFHFIMVTLEKLYLCYVKNLSADLSLSSAVDVEYPQGRLLLIFFYKVVLMSIFRSHFHEQRKGPLLQALIQIFNCFCCGDPSFLTLSRRFTLFRNIPSSLELIPLRRSFLLFLNYVIPFVNDVDSALRWLALSMISRNHSIMFSPKSSTCSFTYYNHY